MYREGGQKTWRAPWKIEEKNVYRGEKSETLTVLENGFMTCDMGVKIFSHSLY